MAIQRITAPMALRMPGVGNLLQGTEPALTSVLIDAVGEYVDFVGRVMWDGYPGSAKTVSSAGGKVVWRTGAVTWAGTTTLRISIQDVDGTTAIPRGDGTPDVYLDIVRGTTALAVTTDYASGAQSAFTTGSKSIAQGDLIAIRFELTAQSGTDAVNVIAKNANGRAFPSVSHKTTAVAALTATPNVMLVADDGTVGWLEGSGFTGALTSRTFDSGTATADEYGSAFTIPFGIEVCGIEWIVRASVVTGAGVDLNLFTGSAGSPTKSRTVTFDSQHFAGSTAATSVYYGKHLFSSPVEITANSWFALTAMPLDTTSDIIMHEYSITNFADASKALAVLGGTVKKATRLNDAGAITEDANAIVVNLAPIISGIDVSSGGGTIYVPSSTVVNGIGAY